MPDRRNGPGDERFPTGRYARPPDDEWVPEAEQTEPLEPGERPMGRPARGERLQPGDRAPGERMPGEPRGVRPPPPPGPAGIDDRGTAGPSGAAAGRDRSTTAGGGPDLGTPAPAPDTARMPDDGLGAPSPGDVTAREAGTTEGTAPDAWPTAPGVTRAPSGAGAPLLPHEEAERWEQRMRQVAAGFVDRPRVAVEEADRALEEIATRFGEAVNRRRRSLRTSWADTGEQGPANEADTEQLRLALRDYRDLAGRLLHF
ncbi:hypothetical protein [Streptomyces sp. NPDC001056]